MSGSSSYASDGFFFKGVTASDSKSSPGDDCFIAYAPLTTKEFESVI